MNRLLPKAIRILDAEETRPDFHPIRDAVAKTYEYRILRSGICPPFVRRYVYHYPYPLDLARMFEMAPLLEGEHDFTCFAAADKSDELGRSKVRTIFSSRCESSSERVIYRVRGSGFLKHMVRNIAGLLLEAGRGNVSPPEIERLLSADSDRKAGPTAPASGLFLVSVEY
jgi:tRNA pseudouridine38-40 synthase